MRKRTKLMRTALALLVLSCLSYGPDSVPARVGGVAREDPEDIRGRALLDIAAAVDGQMGADLTLRLLEANQLRSRRLRREACDVVRLRMTDAVEPCAVEFTDGRFADCREWLVYSALDTYQVDAIGLRCRLSAHLAETEPRSALEFLLEMPPGLGLKAPECRDVLLPKPAHFYATLGQLLNRGISPRERKAGRHVDIVRRYAAGIRTAGDIGPVCELIGSIKATRDGVGLMATDLAGAMDRMTASPRQVFQLASRKRAVESMATLIESLGDQDGAGKRLRESIRNLVLRSLAAPRCADLSGDALPEPVAYFNEMILASHPIVRDDVTNPVRGDVAEIGVLWTSTTSRRLLFDFQNLNTARREMEPGADWTEWTLEYRKYLSRVRNWSSADESSDLDYVSQKASTIVGLVDIAPDDASRLEAIRDFVTMMRHAKTAGTPRYLALWQASIVLGRASEADRKMALELFKASGPDVLAAYAALQLEGIDVFRIERSVA